MCEPLYQPERRGYRPHQAVMAASTVGPSAYGLCRAANTIAGLQSDGEPVSAEVGEAHLMAVTVAA